MTRKNPIQHNFALAMGTLNKKKLTFFLVKKLTQT